MAITGLRWERSIPTLAVLVLVVLGQCSASAGIATYTSESSFTANLQTGYYLNDFSGAGVGDSLVFSQGAFSYTISATPMGGVNGIATHQADVYDAMSTYWENDQLVITFRGTGGYTLPTAVGGYLFWTDLSNPANVIAGTVHAQLNDGTSLDVYSSSGHVNFGGFTTDGTAFTSLTFSLVGYTSGDRFATLDNFYVGSAVPEPSGWVAAGFVALFVIGRTGFGYLRRRQAARQA